MRAAWSLAALVLASASLSGCLGVDNMDDLKDMLGFRPVALSVAAPIARAQASTVLADVAQLVAFTAQASQDPQGLPLEFNWDFGDGTDADGSQATHAWRSPGLYTVTLHAANLAGKEAFDTVVVTVRADLPPVVAFTITLDGKSVERAHASDPLLFTSQVRDPEGQPVKLLWDFGDGTTATTPTATHSSGDGGRYTVSLRAEDPAGHVGTALGQLTLDDSFHDQGHVAMLGPTLDSSPIHVGALAQHITVKTDIEPLLGVNAVILTLVDAAGKEVGRMPLEPPLGTQGVFEKLLDVPADMLQGHAFGDWSVVVQHERGIDVSFTFTAEVTY